MAGWWAEIAQVVAPTTAALVITGGTPTVTVDENRIVTPTPAALTVTGGTPVVTATDHQTVTPTAATLSLTGGTPTVSVGVTVAPTAAALTITGGTPTVLTPRLVTPTGASLTITGGTPSLGLTLRPTGASLSITGGTPTVTVAVNQPTLLGVTITAGTSITLPAHAAGNYIQIFAYNAGGTTTPVKPSPGATVPALNDIDANVGANINASRLVDFVATANNHTSGTWGASADFLIASVWSGQHTTPVGGHAESGSASTSGATAPSTTLTNTDGSSALAHYLGRRDSDWTAWGSAPAGYTVRASLGAGVAGVCLITKDSTTSDGSVTRPTDGATSIGYRGQTVEIRQH